MYGIHEAVPNSRMLLTARKVRDVKKLFGVPCGSVSIMGRKARTTTKWRTKVQPLLIEAVRLLRKDDEAAAKGLSVEERTRRFLAGAQELLERHPTRPASSQVQPFEVIYSNVPHPNQTTESDIAIGRFEMLAWEKLRKPLRGEAYRRNSPLARRVVPGKQPAGTLAH